MARDKSTEGSENVQADEEHTDQSGNFEPYVEWRGDATFREVTEDQWREAGVKDQATVNWNRNTSRVPLSDLTDEARQRLAGEPGFFFVHEASEETD